MNVHLLKHFIKTNWLLWLGVLAFIHVELVTMIFMMELIADTMSNMNFPGMDVFKTDKVDGAYALDQMAGLYPMYMIMFPMIFFIMVAHKVMSKSVDNTSISTHFTAGITRREYVLTAFIFIALSIVAMFLVTYVVCGLCMTFWGAIDWGAWAIMNLAFLFLNLAIASICFFCSTVFAPKKIGLALSVGIPVILIILAMFVEYVPAIKYFNPMAWLDTTKIVSGVSNLWWLWTIIYGIITVGFVLATVLIFRKRRLSI